ncbi:MAG: hypothetical protein OEV44_00145 [Spirochaetota bacterium]|nr:hypothetical protein [Spirochaetota bacterium]
MKTQERLNETIYIIKHDEIEEDIFKTIIEDYFRDETTTPGGVAPRMHIREEGAFETTDGELHRTKEEAEQWIKDNDLENEIKDKRRWELWSWGISGNHPKFQESYETEEEAEEALWKCWLNNFDYDNGSGLNDAPAFFFDKKEAEEYLEQL